MSIIFFCRCKRFWSELSLETYLLLSNHVSFFLCSQFVKVGYTMGIILGRWSYWKVESCMEGFLYLNQISLVFSNNISYHKLWPLLYVLLFNGKCIRPHFEPALVLDSDLVRLSIPLSEKCVMNMMIGQRLKLISFLLHESVVWLDISTILSLLWVGVGLCAGLLSISATAYSSCTKNSSIFYC